MSDNKVLIGDMDRKICIEVLKRLLEAMEVFDGISPSPERINALKMAIASLETEEASTVLEIPNNPTNGDMIKAMFPNWKIIKHELAFRIYPYGNDSAYFFFDKKWWNAPYKRGTE